MLENDEPLVKDKPVEVEIGGVKYLVTPQLAESMKAEQKKHEEALEAAKKPIDSPPEPPPVREPVTVNDDGELEVGDRLFQEPDKVLKEQEQRIMKKMRQEYEQEEAPIEEAEKLLNQFYTDFFNENKELQEDRELVEMLFERNYGKWNQEAKGDLSVLKKKLAEKSQETILRGVRRNQTPESHEQSDSVILEGGGTQPQKQLAPEPTEENSSLTAVIKNKHKRRQEAAHAN